MGKKRKGSKSAKPASRSASSIGGAQEKGKGGSRHADCVPREYFDSRLGASGVAFLVLFAVLLVCQGGYFPEAACVCGIAAGLVALLLAVRGRLALRGAPLVPTAFALVGCACLIGSACAGMTLGMASAASSWFAVAAVALVGEAAMSESRQGVVRGFCWVGVVAAFVGLLMYAQFVPIEGSVNAGRLQFLFQYANAAGVFFAACALLCSFARGRLRSFAAAPICALLLTQSMGAVAVFAAAVVVVAALRLRAGDRDLVRALLAQTVIGVAAFAICAAAGAGYLAGIATAALLVAGIAYPRIERVLPPVGALGGVLVLAVAAVAALLAATGRLVEASQTFIERFIQMGDAFSLLMMSPLFGIGADMWQFAYPFVQSAQYVANVVHGSYVQIALDGGIVALALVLVAVVGGAAHLVRQVRRELPDDGAASSPRAGARRGDPPPAADRGCDQGRLAAALVVAVHAAIDFDLQFSALAVLLAFLLAGARIPLPRLCPAAGGEPSAERAPRRMPRAAVYAVCCACAVAASAFGLRCGLELSAIEAAGEAGDVAEVQERLASDLLAERDVSAQTALLRAYVETGDPAAEAWVEDHGIATWEQAILCANALIAADDADGAAAVLVAELEREPLNPQLGEAVDDYFEEAGVPASVADRYEAAVARANELIERWPASLLSNQELRGAFDTEAYS